MMDTSKTGVSLYVTFVEKEGPFLKIWGQTDKTNSVYVEQFLIGATPQFDVGIAKVTPENIQLNTLVCAKYKDSKYYRARVLNNAFIREGFVEVSFLDYGNKDIVPIDNIRSLQSFPTSFISVQPLATGFIFAEAHCVGGGEWNETIFDSIVKDIKYREVHCQILSPATQYYLVKIFIDNTDLCNVLIQRGLMQPISLQAQQAVLLSMSMQRQSQTANAPPLTSSTNNLSSGALNTYKASTLEPSCLYPVYVSYVNDGPCHFSVQLKNSEEVLVKLMNEINSINLRLLEDVPIPGTICLARCQEDGNICRAVVTNEVDNQFKVFYVDFGNYEVVPLDSLYQIPFKYVLPKVMAIRVCLNGVEKSTVTLEMQKAFKQFVDNRLLHMKVMPSPQRMAIPKCELWDPETKTSAFDVVHRAARHAYPEPIALTRGFSQQVKVSYVYSCNRFYVQLSSKENELTTLMADLQEICQSNESIDPALLKTDLPCCALYEVDGQWYRSQVVEVVGDGVIVRYIDYGNEEPVTKDQLKDIDGDQLTVLRPQAIECCLNGYQNMDDDSERDQLLEELILENEFTMKVVEMLNKKALVELYDANNCNVASLLLDRLAMATSQVSPALVVQAGNKIEHKKTFSQQNAHGRGGDGQVFTYDREERPDRQDRGGDRFDRGGDRFDRGGDRFDRGGDRFDRGGDRFDRGGDRFDRGGDRFDRGGDRQGRGDRRDRGERGDRGDRQGRERRDFNKAPNENWRQDGNKEFRKYDKNSNDNGQGSWRQNNKGFSPKHENKYNKPAESDAWNTSAFSSNTNNNWNNQNNKQKEWNGRTNNENLDGGGGGGDPWNTGTSNNDEWNTPATSSNNDEWSRPANDRGGRGGGRFNNDRGDRGGGRADKFRGKSRERDGGFRNKIDSRSDNSYEGSEKGYQHKGPRTSSRNDRFQKNFDRPRGNSTFQSASDDSWNVSAVTTPIDAAPVTATYSSCRVVGTEAQVAISWFHNPSHFYLQLVDSQNEFKVLMDDIQQFYKSRKPETIIAVGAPVIGLFSEDNVLYRAQLLEVLGSEYKIYYVDFGNVSTVTKIWPIDNKFLNLPAQAIVCSLKDVAPPGESGTWAATDDYGSYFDQANFVCKFVDEDENKTYVFLFNGSEDVSEALVKNKLAVSTKSSIPPVEIPLLFHQQFRAVIISVNNLKDIVLKLECGSVVCCAMHNLDAATETHEGTLKAMIDKTVIVYVDNVIEDKLEVTLYDVEGNKIDILSPDEGAFDTVESLCQALVLSKTVSGYVFYAEGTCVYIQLNEYSQTVDWLCDHLFEVYNEDNDNDGTGSIVPEEDMIYAVRSKDGNWYRGRVLSFDEEKTVTVYYVDYGNTEDVSFDDLRVLVDQFKEACECCIKVDIGAEATPYMNQDVTASIYFGKDSCWEGTVYVSEQETDPSTEVVTIEDIGVANTYETHETVPLGNVEENPETVPIEEAEENTESVAIENYEEMRAYTEAEGNEEWENLTADIALDKRNLHIPVGVDVFLSHMDTPNEFYLQLSDFDDAITLLQEDLQNKISDMPILENRSPGMLCAAPYSLDQEWYRAEILDADEDITTLRFIDFGNTDVIENEKTQIKSLLPEFLTLTDYATKCSLMLKPLDEEWSPRAMELLKEIISTDMIADFVQYDGKLSYVELYANMLGEDYRKVSDVLVEEGLAISTRSEIENAKMAKSNCFVSNSISPSEFWIQFDNCIRELEWISEQLSVIQDYPDLEYLTPGTLCAALFSDDQMWYRARILSNTTDGLELLFIDYGNTCTGSSVKQLPEDLVMLPPLATKCCLEKPEGLDTWSQEASKKFSKLSADGKTVFVLNKIIRGETSTVQLLLDDEDISLKLIEAAADNDDSDEAKEDEEEGETAVSAENNEIVVEFGNDSQNTKSNDEHNMPQFTKEGYITEIESLENLKIDVASPSSDANYKLATDGDSSFDGKATEKFKEINKEGTTLYQIEFLENRTVRLYLEGIDIRKLLDQCDNIGHYEEEDFITNEEETKADNDKEKTVFQDESETKDTNSTHDKFEMEDEIDTLNDSQADLKTDEYQLDILESSEPDSRPIKTTDSSDIPVEKPIIEFPSIIQSRIESKMENKDFIDEKISQIENEKGIQSDVETRSESDESQSGITKPAIPDLASVGDKNSSDIPLEKLTTESPSQTESLPHEKTVGIEVENKDFVDNKNLTLGNKKDTQYDLQTSPETDESLLNIPKPSMSDIASTEVSDNFNASTDLQSVEFSSKMENLPNKEAIEDNKLESQRDSATTHKDSVLVKSYTQDSLQTDPKRSNSDMDLAKETFSSDATVDTQISDCTSKIGNVVGRETPEDKSKTCQSLRSKLDSVEPTNVPTNTPIGSPKKGDNQKADQDVIAAHPESSGDKLNFNNISTLSSTKQNSKETEIKTNEYDDAFASRPSSKSSPQGSREPSRSSSRRSSRRCSHDERILPGFLSRPESPFTDNSLSKVNADAEITMLLDNVIDRVTGKRDNGSSEPHSRSHSRLSHDERIVPGVVSRPASPLPKGDKI